MSLGPQCLQCKRRRVKCDSESPHCRKCARDGYECPGYTKALQWVAFRPQKKKNRRRIKVPEPSPPTTLTASSLPSPPNSTPILTPSSPRLEELVDDCRALSCITPLQSPCLYSDADKRAFRVYETITFFNTQVCPDLSASNCLGKETVDTAFWLGDVPNMMQDLLAVTVFAFQAVRYGCSVEKELYEHRGLMLHELGRYLRTPSEQTDSISLHMLVGIMQQEVRDSNNPMSLTGVDGLQAYLSPIHDFRIHLDAARHIIAELGGLKACLKRWPASADNLASFIYTDVFSTTTTPASDLTLSSIGSQKQHLQHFPHFEDLLLHSGCPCPVAIFESLIRINELRATPHPSPEPWSLHFLEVLDEIQTFNAWTWAGSLDRIIPADADDGRVDAVNEWATWASCHQAAALIYLVESARSSHRHLTDDTNLARLSTALAAEARHQLLQDLKYLFASYPCRTATPLAPQLWRFLIWPLVMYAYETVASRITAPEETVIRLGPTLWDDLRDVGVVLASHSLLAGTNMLEECETSATALVWDDLFRRGCVFSL